jgi:phosphoenolpyruvate carboxykinase (GTP)
MTTTRFVEKWVDEAASLTAPTRVVWCDGSEAEYDRLVDQMLGDGTLLSLNQKTYPGCYLHRSHPSDVARTEQLTFICSRDREDAGPTNNWMAPEEAKDRLSGLFRRSMHERTMYVIPYLMGPVGSPMSRVGVMVTDSPYVVASMHIMSRVGRIALDHMRHAEDFVAGLHSLGDLSPDRRFIMHFPDERLIWSVGSGYGGNALLGKKCHALRIASAQARQEGWMAEHMLILGVEDPDGQVTYLAAAMPSASGKTNLAMVVSKLPGYRVWTVGDDIAWIYIDPQGQLRAVNPERGFFGVAPNTSPKTNPNGMAMVRSNTIFTNVALTPSGEPWWEGMTEEPPAELLDWQGHRWDPAKGPAAHPNSRFTVPVRQCPSISPSWESPEGVPISGFIFGSRRARVVPLVFEGFDWAHGVFLGSAMGTETTAAITGKVGVVRRDPMAMIPFCGYNMADYFGHWLSFGPRLAKPPKIFRVNWFRRDGEGRFLWPGYGENVRILKWIIGRIRGTAGARETPIGYIPRPADLDLEGLDVPGASLEAALHCDRDEWFEALDELRVFYEQFGQRLPAPIREAHAQTARRFRV